MSFPSVPADGTGFTDSFLTLAEYQAMTGDTALEQAQLDVLLPMCELMLAVACEATWRYGQYTETLKLYQNGYVYPSATPIDITKAINSSGDGSAIWDPATASVGAYSPIQGVGLMVGNWAGWDFNWVFGAFAPAQVQITYWGGWDDQSQNTRGDVWIFKRCLAKMARYGSQPQFATTGGLGDINSMSIGGISISGGGGSAGSGGLNAMMLYDQGMVDDIASLKRANVGGWQV